MKTVVGTLVGLLVGAIIGVYYSSYMIGSDKKVYKEARHFADVVNNFNQSF